MNAQLDSRAGNGHELARSAYSTERGLFNHDALRALCRSMQVPDDVQLPIMYQTCYQQAAFHCVCASMRTRICSIWQCGIAIAQ